MLEALIEPAQGLVALEDVLERAAPGSVDGERLVRCHRPVDERPVRAAAVPLAKLLEGLIPLPDVQDLQLQSRMIGFVR